MSPSAAAHLDKVSILKQDNMRRRLLVDVLIFCALAAISWVSLFSIEYTKEQNVWAELWALKTNYSRQFLWILISLFAGLIILNLKYIILTATAPALYVLGMVGMVLTVFFGNYNRGSHSWINIGGVNVQFAEFMIFFTILFLSKYVSSLDFNIHKQKHRFFALCIFIAPFILTVAQRELGLGLVFLPLILVLYREGLPAYFLLVPLYLIALGVLSIAVSSNTFMIAIGSLAVALAVFLYKRLLKNKTLFLLGALVLVLSILLQGYALPWTMKTFLQPYQIKRIYSTFSVENPDQNFSEVDLINNMESGSMKRKHDNNYNVFQSIVAIGSGGAFGKGFLKNTQTRLNFVPEQSTDFIFCSFAESFGFAGALLLISLFTWMIFRLLHNAETQRDTQVRAYTYGFVAVFFFHIVINLGMTVGLLPVVGIPLPFISYGGSSFITFSIIYFVLLRLSTNNAHY